tara:strand:+ start:149 stop:769 length:621 start_codon:yes stop_codon:yes gene_type:complete
MQKRGKKGQIYILAAIIIGFLLFTIISPINLVHQKITDDDFEELSKNYRIESAKLLNEILNEEERTPQQLEAYFLNFTLLFTSYSKTKNPDFGIIYAFPFEGQLLIGNYLNQDITFNPGGSLNGCFDDVRASVSLMGLQLNVQGIDLATYQDCVTNTAIPPNNQLNFEIFSVPYTFILNPNRPDIIMISRESLGEDIKIYTSMDTI